eukprot:12171472-Alexandrium_andersonii.AAC.1
MSMRVWRIRCVPSMQFRAASAASRIPMPRPWAWDRLRAGARRARSHGSWSSCGLRLPPRLPRRRRRSGAAFVRRSAAGSCRAVLAHRTLLLLLAGPPALPGRR